MIHPNTYNELLSRFVFPDESRPKFQRPYSDGERLCATDTHALIRITPAACGLIVLPEAENKQIKVTPDIDFPLSLSVLDAAIAKVPHEPETEVVVEREECEECDGDGTVEWEYRDSHFTMHTHFADCPICHGTGAGREEQRQPTGRFIPVVNTSIKIGNTFFCAWQLQRLSDAAHTLGLDAIRVRHMNRDDAALFTLTDDCEIILMPLSSVLVQGAHAKINISK